MEKINFAVILTEDKKTVLVISNSPAYQSIKDWQTRFRSTNDLVLYASQVESLDIDLSHYFLS